MSNYSTVVRPSRSIILRTILAASLQLLVAAHTAASQSAAAVAVMADDIGARACLDSLSDASLGRVTVFQHAVVQDTNSALSAQVGLVSQHIADRARAALGSSGDSIPDGAALGVWRVSLVHLPLAIVLRRDGSWTWRAEHGGDPGNPKVTAFYVRVLRAIPADSLWMLWPDSYKADSVAVHLDVMSENPYEHAPSLGVSLFPVFTAKGLVRLPAMLVQRVAPVYPADALGDSITAKVLVDVVIGTDGRPDTATLRVRSPSAAMLADSPMAHVYREFVDATREVVTRERFRPARIGGCEIRQLAHLSFDYVPRSPTPTR
jgi:cell division protein FtsB